jgi:hypothetical protein
MLVRDPDKLLQVFLLRMDSLLVTFGFLFCQKFIVNAAFNFLVDILVFVKFCLVLDHFVNCRDVVVANSFVHRGFRDVYFPLKALKIINDVLRNLNCANSFLLILILLLH